MYSKTYGEKREIAELDQCLKDIRKMPPWRITSCLLSSFLRRLFTLAASWLARSMLARSLEMRERAVVNLAAYRISMTEPRIA